MPVYEKSKDELKWQVPKNVINNTGSHFCTQTSFYANMSAPRGLIISNSDMNMACSETLQEPAAPYMTASLRRELFPVC